MKIAFRPLEVINEDFEKYNKLQYCLICKILRRPVVSITLFHNLKITYLVVYIKKWLHVSLVNIGLQKIFGMFFGVLWMD